MSSTSSSSFYADLSNPRLLSEDEIARLSPGQMASLNEQLDQNILHTLQRIDANFAGCTRTITDGILPALEGYGRSSKQVWDSVKLWKTFFEAAAGIKLAPDHTQFFGNAGEGEHGHVTYEDGEDDETVQEVLLGEQRGVEDEDDGQLEGDVTARLDNDNDNALGRNLQQEDASYADQTVEDSRSNNSNNGDITFDAKGGQQQQQQQKRDRREPEWADQASPFEILRQDIGKIQVSSSRPPPSLASAAAAAMSDASYASSSYIPAPTLGSSSFTAGPVAGASASGKSTAKAAARNQARLRDLSMDSPDVYRPTLHDPTFNAAAPARDTIFSFSGNNDAKGKARQQPYQKEEAEAQDYRNHRENPSYFFNDPPAGGRGDSTTDHGTPASISSSFDLSNLEPPSVLRRDEGRERENPSSSRPNLGPRQISAGNSNTAKKAALLQKVLTKNMVGKDGRPNASTPAKGLISRNTAAGGGQGKDFFPLDLPSDWNGIADLSKTPLSSFESPQKTTISRSFFQNNDAQDPTPLRYGGQRLQSGSTASSSSIFGGGGLNAQADAAGGNDASLSFADYIKRFNPPTHSLSASSSSSRRLSRTPAKEAARMVSRDVLERATTATSRTGYREEVLDSPGGFDPPSVVKNWATRGYAIPTSASASAGRGGRRMTDSPNSFGGDSPVAGGQLSRMQQQQKMPSSMLGNAGHEEEEEGDSFEAEFDDDDGGAPPLAAPPPQPNFRHLADDGDELGLSQGAVIGSNTSQPIQQQQQAPGGEEWGGDSFEDDDEEEGESFDDPPIPAGQDDNIAYEDQQVPLKDEAGEGDSFDSDNNASRSFEEETLFGAARRNRDSEGFRLNGPEDMVTLHGGRLLESQPFEASPLAGRDARYGL